MKKLVQLIIAVSFTVLTLNNECSSQDNLLLKEDFETGTVMPDEWQSGANLPGVKYVYDKENGRSGQRSLSLQKSAKRYFPIAQWFRKAPFESDLGGLKITSQVRAENATNIEATYVNATKNDGEAADEKELKNKVEIKIGKEIGHYLGVPAKSKEAPEKGYGLLVVLPGGDGSADFHPFVANILENSLADDFVLAQPLAKKWTDDQAIVWPTTKLRVKKMGYTTEKLIDAVVKDVAGKTKIDPKRVYALGWSSGGPAVYAAPLKKTSPLAGGFVAMSVYKPNLLPARANAKDRSIYILHSPEDRVCPYWMAKNGYEELTKSKARTKLVDYEGGHGWHGDVFGNIRNGVDWLDEAK